MLLAIPTSREKLDKHIINACEFLNVSFQTFDIYADNWIERIREIKPDGCIYIPEFRFQAWRDLFNERIRFIKTELNIPIYPDIHELDLYESKRKMSYWLKANDISHPDTWIFGCKEDAEKFLKTAEYPLIFKTDFGNASYGVRLLPDQRTAINIVKQSFGNGYSVPYFKEHKLDLKNRVKAYIRPLYRKINNIRHLPRDVEIDVILFQKRINIIHEWRLIKVGEYYFGHEKVSNDEGFHSGSGNSKWTIPPFKVFNFAKEVCRIGKFSTMSLDIFEDENGLLMVNELQTIFGVIAKNQMYSLKNGHLVGIRYYFNQVTQQWLEEEGEFGQDYGFRLRITDFTKKLNLKNSIN